MPLASPSLQTYGFLFPTRLQVLTNAEKLGIHAVEVGHEEEANGPWGIKEEQETSWEVEQQSTPMHHEQTGHRLGQH